MSKKTYTVLHDDMEEGEVEADAGTISFGLDGKSYEIDLSTLNAKDLRGKLAPFVKNARLVKGARGTKPPRLNRDQSAAVRQWARKNGFDISTKGRIPEDAQAAFDEAHQPEE